MIDIKNLSYTVDNVKIFENAQISIPKGQMTIIAGLNGSGKTTLLKIISGIIKPRSIDMKTNSKEIFYLPQRIKYPENITLWEYIESSFYKQSWKWFLSKEEKIKINEVLSLLELENKKDTLTDNLSSGELQKANIALGLVSDADVFLLDEPTSNMDLVNQIKVLDIIKKLVSHGITCVIVLHDISLLSKYGDNFIGFTKDLKIISGSRREFITKDVLKQIFGIDFKVINNDKECRIEILN